MQEYLNMFRYIVFSFLIADLIFNVEGCSSIASFVDFVSDPITPENEVGGNVYNILKHYHSSKVLQFEIPTKDDRAQLSFLF